MSVRRRSTSAASSSSTPQRIHPPTATGDFSTAVPQPRRRKRSSESSAAGGVNRRTSQALRAECVIEVETPSVVVNRGAGSASAARPSDGEREKPCHRQCDE